MLALFLREVLDLEEPLLGKVGIVHMYDRYRPTVRVLSSEVRPLPGECLHAFIAPTPVRQVGGLVVSYLRNRRHVRARQGFPDSGFLANLATGFDLLVNVRGMELLAFYITICFITTSTIDHSTAFSDGRKNRAYGRCPRNYSGRPKPGVLLLDSGFLSFIVHVYKPPSRSNLATVVPSGFRSWHGSFRTRIEGPDRIYETPTSVVW